RFPAGPDPQRSRSVLRRGGLGRVASCRFLLAGGAVVPAFVAVPADFSQALLGCSRLRLGAERGVDGELQINARVAAVAVDLPVMDRQFTEGRSAGHGQPLSRRIDQVADLFHLQAHGQLAAALERYQQGVAGLDGAAVACYLIATRCEGAALGQGVLRVEQGVAEIVGGHGASEAAGNASTPGGRWPPWDQALAASASRAMAASSSSSAAWAAGLSCLSRVSQRW